MVKIKTYLILFIFIFFRNVFSIDSSFFYFLVTPCIYCVYQLITNDGNKLKKINIENKFEEKHKKNKEFFFGEFHEEMNSFINFYHEKKFDKNSFPYIFIGSVFGLAPSLARKNNINNDEYIKGSLKGALIQVFFESLINEIFNRYNAHTDINNIEEFQKNTFQLSLFKSQFFIKYLSLYLAYIKSDELVDNIGKAKLIDMRLLYSKLYDIEKTFKLKKNEKIKYEENEKNFIYEYLLVIYTKFINNNFENSCLQNFIDNLTNFIQKYDLVYKEYTQIKEILEQNKKYIKYDEYYINLNIGEVFSKKDYSLKSIEIANNELEKIEKKFYENKEDLLRCVNTELFHAYKRIFDLYESLKQQKAKKVSYLLDQIFDNNVISPLELNYSKEKIIAEIEKIDSYIAKSEEVIFHWRNVMELKEKILDQENDLKKYTASWYMNIDVPLKVVFHDTYRKNISEMISYLSQLKENAEKYSLLLYSLGTIFNSLNPIYSLGDKIINYFPRILNFKSFKKFGNELVFKELENKFKKINEKYQYKNFLPFIGKNEYNKEINNILSIFKIEKEIFYAYYDIFDSCFDLEKLFNYKQQIKEKYDKIIFSFKSNLFYPIFLDNCQLPICDNEYKDFYDSVHKDLLEENVIDFKFSIQRKEIYNREKKIYSNLEDNMLVISNDYAKLAEYEKQINKKQLYFSFGQKTFINNEYLNLLRNNEELFKKEINCIGQRKINIEKILNQVKEFEILIGEVSNYQNEFNQFLSWIKFFNDKNERKKIIFEATQDYKALEEEAQVFIENNNPQNINFFSLLIIKKKDIFPLINELNNMQKNLSTKEHRIFLMIIDKNKKEWERKFKNIVNQLSDIQKAEMEKDISNIEDAIKKYDEQGNDEAMLNYENYISTLIKNFNVKNNIN